MEFFGGAPRGFFGTNWGSDRKEKRWGEGCTVSTGERQWRVTSGERREKRKAKLEKRNSKFGKSRKSERQDWKMGKGAGRLAERAEGERDQLG